VEHAWDSLSPSAPPPNPCLRVLSLKKKKDHIQNNNPEYINIPYKTVRKDEQCNGKMKKTLEKPIHKISKWPMYMKRSSTS